MASAIVLGAGMVGSVIATDLAADFDVTVADVRPDALARASRRANGRVQVREADLADPAVVGALVERADIVLGALASGLGFQTLRAVIEAGKNYCDISFMPENALDLDDLARECGVTAVVDCGVAPGMSNMICGHAVATLDDCRSLEIYVGGLPLEPRWPFHYKAAFSPADVIEEYTRPSRIVENGELVVREALSEPEPIDLPGVGTLEAFNTDGLRSLATTLSVPEMKEKTLRHAGHIELMRIFREIGLFGKEPILVGGAEVRPLDVMSALMFPMWSYDDGEKDLTVMRVIAEGTKGNTAQRMVWDLLDHYDTEMMATSMSRTTAFPCAIVARLIHDGTFERPGVNPPEHVGREPGMLDRVLTDLRLRGVEFTSSIESA